jgi:cytochrome c oxidase subunit 2
MEGILDYLMDEEGNKAEGKEPIEAKQPMEQKVEAEVVEEQSVEPTATNKPAIPANPGQTLADQNGCLGCHSIDGTRIVGPSFKGMMERERTIIRGEQKEKILADSDYLTRSIREPSAEVVEGYPAIMPPFPDLSDDDIKALQDWLETLK